MADIQHVDIVDANCHEPKHITSSVISDTGKVITPSSSTNGESEIRTLVASEIGNKLVTVNTLIDDVSSVGGEGWVATPVAGELTKVDVVIYGALTVADAALTVRINAIAVTLSVPLTLVFTGSAAGDTFSADVTGGGTLTANDAIQITSDGASTGAVSANITCYIEES